MPYVRTSLIKPKAKSKATDVSSIEGLTSFAESKGLEVKEKKPGLFMRAIDILSRPLYASAGFAKAIVKKENPLQEAWKGLTGREKETYSDVLQELGVDNKWVKGGVGFALDVALDPATYFGGSLIRGVGKGISTVGRYGIKASRKMSPLATQSLEMAGTNLKDALGHAFKFGYGTSKGLSDDVGKFFNKVGIAKEEIIEKNFRALNKFDNKTLQEATNISFRNKRLEKLFKEGGKPVNFLTGTGKVAEAVTEMKKIGANIGKLTGLPEEQLFKNYIPSILKMQNRMAVDASKGIKVNFEGWRKKFNDLIPEEKLNKKPIELFTRREVEVTRNNIARETLKNAVDAWGLSAKNFDKLDNVAKLEWKPIYEKGFKPLTTFPVKNAAGKIVRAVGKQKKPLGYLKANDFKFINNYMFPEMKTINMLAKASGYDKFTRFFKTAVTAWFPAFHVRNWISGNVQNYSVLGAEALNPKNIFGNGLGIMRKTKKVLKFKHWTGTGEDMSKIMNENFRGASRYISDLSDYIDDLGTKGFKIKSKIQKLNPRQIGNFIEMWQKSTAVSTALNKGKTLKEAIKLAEQAGFDYTKITQFESKIMRRAIPFYTFARKNAELQARTFIKNPRRILSQIKFTKNLSEIFGGGKPTEEDLKGIPSWALNSLGFKIEGNRFLTKFGLPLEDFVERVAAPGKTTLSSLNPLIKFPLEVKLGRDFFREQKIIDIKKISPVSGEIIMNKAPQWMKDFMNVKKIETDYGTKYYASPKSLHILRNIPTARFQGTLEKMFENDKQSVDKWLAFLTGAKIYDIDVELQKYFTDRDLQRDIEDQLLQIGEGARFERFYVPKSQK